MAITLDTSTLIAASTSDPVTGNHTCDADAKLLVATLVCGVNGRTGAPTYNSVPLTQADSTRSSSLNPEAFAELWYLPGPDTGSAYAISVPNPLGLSLEVCTSSYIPDADCDVKLDVATGGQNNSSANPSVSTTPLTNSAVIVAVVASGHDTWAPSARSGTQLYDTDNGTWGSGHQYYVQDGTPAAKAMSWTQAAEDWGMVVAAFGSYGIGIHVSKSNVYEIVTGSNEALSVAKANVYEVVTGSNEALSVAKANVYEIVTGSNEALSVEIGRAHV